MPCQNCELRLSCAAELELQSCTPELLDSAIKGKREFRSTRLVVATRVGVDRSIRNFDGHQPEIGKVVNLGSAESPESGKGRKKTETAVPLRPGDTLVRNRIEPP